MELPIKVAAQLLRTAGGGDVFHFGPAYIQTQNSAGGRTDLLSWGETQDKGQRF